MTKPTKTSATPYDHLPLDRLPRDFVERLLALGDMQAAFLEDALAKGVPDRARLREGLETYGRLRLDILNYLGEDPASEELMPLPVALHDS